ncbi:TldE protein, part of TldE/TldD proteolytic complex [hydrothermal vent metagenome]|uniref:TldE protein, part of TldE/TldD proteolytic complex n=1 Tax=hydrothermal vent metagenome TaxID=652676 RepID=A0A3B0Z5R7_9ZZZZ
MKTDVDLKDVVAQLLEESRKQGATAAEADVSVVTGLSVNVRMGDVETIEYNKDRGVGLTVYIGDRSGSASTSDFSARAIKETVTAACGIAKYTQEDEYSGLAEAELMAYDYPDLDLHHHWDVSPEKAIELGMACESAAREEDTRITNSEGASVSTHEGFRVYGNSHGFMGAYHSSRHGVSCAVIAQSGESMQRDYWYSTARNSDELDDVEEVGRVAAQRAVARLNARQLSTRQVPVIFSCDVSSSLVSSFLGAIRGDSLYRKSSFLLDSLGETVFPGFFSIREEPHLKGALGSAPFDGEGVRTQNRTYVQDGIVQSYILDGYSARKLGMQNTGNAGGVHNLIVKPGNNDLSAMMKEMGEGLVITELMGQGVNRVTGDYSRGATGFWVEQGEIAYPVEEITVAGNLRDMFREIAAVGSDVDVRRNVRVGSLLVNGMTIAGGQ